jgi:menaquinone-9 beta-reductase
MKRPTTTRREIEIIGGGLAGLSLGLALRRSKVPVTIHEAGDYPRHRVCGEFISGLADATTARLGLGPILADALLHREVAWQMRDREPQIQQLPAPALGISRYRLDARLAEEFVRAGGELRCHSRMTEKDDAPGRVFATGRRRLTRSPWMGLKIHARDLPLTRDLEMHLGEECYVGLSRVEEGIVNVCGLFRRRAVTERGYEVLFAYLSQAGLHELSDRLRRATLDLDSFSAVAALGFDRGQSSRGRLCVGDAAAAIPPFTGNGMAMAFQSAELALDPLLAYATSTCNWREACRATDAALRGRFRVRLASAHALHPFLLRPQPQRWFAALSRARLIPFRPLYASLH